MYNYQATGSILKRQIKSLAIAKKFKVVIIKFEWINIIGIGSI